MVRIAIDGAHRRRWCASQKMVRIAELGRVIWERLVSIFDHLEVIIDNGFQFSGGCHQE
jgi:hypothetical protein